MTWHYLPVYVEHNGEREYTVCEVYLDENHYLENWTQARDIAAGGSTIEELARDLEMMREDVARWKPVAFEQLVVGMVLEQADGADSQE